MFHLSLSKKSKTEVYRTEESDPEVDLDVEEHHYDVKKILRWRRAAATDRKKEYLVLWAGYLVEEATWEREASFDDPEALGRRIEEDKPPENKFS